MFVRVRDAAFHVREHGVVDPPLVLTGALTMGAEAWQLTTDRLVHERRVVSLDQRGAGRTQGPTHEMTVDSQADDLIAVLEALGVERCVHGTESTGSAAALAAAARRPDLFAGLVLVAPNWWMQLDADRDAPAPDVDEAIAWLVDTSFGDVRDEVLLRWGRDVLTGDPTRFLDHQRVAGNLDLRAAAPSVTAPVLLLHGDADRVVPSALSRTLAGLLPDARLEVVSGAAHAMLVTHADEAAAAIRRFLAEVAG